MKPGRCPWGMRPPAIAFCGFANDVGPGCDQDFAREQTKSDPGAAGAFPVSASMPPRHRVVFLQTKSGWMRPKLSHGADRSPARHRVMICEGTQSGARPGLCPERIVSARQRVVIGSQLGVSEMAPRGCADDFSTHVANHEIPKTPGTAVGNRARPAPDQSAKGAASSQPGATPRVWHRRTR